jgi:hypothetical protein
MRGGRGRCERGRRSARASPTRRGHQGFRACSAGSHVLRSGRRTPRRHKAALDRLPDRRTDASAVPDFADALVGRMEDAERLAAARAALRKLRRVGGRSSRCASGRGCAYASPLTPHALDGPPTSAPAGHGGGGRRRRAWRGRSATCTDARPCTRAEAVHERERIGVPHEHRPWARAPRDGAPWCRERRFTQDDSEGAPVAARVSAPSRAREEPGVRGTPARECAVARPPVWVRRSSSVSAPP